MNDIRNLMGNLQTQLEYKEFDVGTRAPTDSWPVLDRLSRAGVGPEAQTTAPAALFPPTAAMTPSAAPPVDAVDPEPSLVAGLHAAAAARSARAGRATSPSLLGRYAAAEPTLATAPDPQAARQLPLVEVFARLERTGR